MLTHQRLREILHYDPDTGVFTWKQKLSSRGRVGQKAGSIFGDGYRYIGVQRRYYRVCRLAWFYVSGTWPLQIDHINRTTDDDRFANLREATTSQNMANRAIKSPRSGYKGVVKNKSKYQARIKFDGRTRHIGVFETPQEAAKAYDVAARNQFGEFAVLNFPTEV